MRITDNDAIARSYNGETGSIKFTLKAASLDGRTAIFNTEAWSRTYNESNSSLNLNMIIYDEVTGDPYEIYISNGELLIRIIGEHGTSGTAGTSGTSGTSGSSGSSGTAGTAGTGVPSTIPNLKIWLRPEEVATLGNPDGTGTINWNDASGNGKVASAPVDEPQWYNNVINGLGSIHFNGSTTWPQFYMINDMSLSETLGADMTLFTVFKSELSATTTIISDNYDCTGGFILGANPLNDGSLRFKGHENVGSTGATTAVGYLDDTFMLVYCVYDSSNEVYLNGVPSGEVVGESNFSGAYATLFLGNAVPYSSYPNKNTFFKGYISEVIIYNRELSPTEITDVNDYLKNKYGL